MIPFRLTKKKKKTAVGTGRNTHSKDRGQGKAPPVAQTQLLGQLVRTSTQ